MAVIILPDAQADLLSLQDYMLYKWGEAAWLKAEDEIRCLTPHHLQIAPHCVADSRHAVFRVWCGMVSHPRYFSIGFPIELNLGSARRSRTSQEASERSGARQVRSAGATIYAFQINPMDLSLAKRT